MNESLSPRVWTSEELARLYQARINLIPYSVVAPQIGRSVAECEDKWRNDDNWKERLGFENQIAEATKGEEKDILYAKLSERHDSRLHMSRLQADIWGDRLVQAIRPWNEVPEPKLWQPSSNHEDHAEEEMGLILSDLHIGLKFTHEETGGLGEFSLKTFIRRNRNLMYGVRDIRELHSKMYRIPVLNVFCIGDVTHGMNNVGKWSAAYIELPITEQVAAGVHSLSESLMYFLSMFKEVRFFGTSGNHGRAADKGVEKEHVNWDYICYQMLAARFANNPRIKFYCPKTWWQYPTIKNHKFLIMHGEDVKGGNYPVKSLANVEAKIAGIMRDHPDYTMIGHFHTASELSTNHGELFVNGCFPPEVGVWMADGTFLPISEVKAGDMVSGKLQRSTPVEAVKVKPYLGRLTCFRTVDNSTPVRCTPNHMILAVKAQQVFARPNKCAKGSEYMPLQSPEYISSQVTPEYISAANLSVGDYVAVSRDLSLSRSCSAPMLSFGGKKHSITRIVARMIGLYLAEGSISGVNGKNHHVDFTFHIKERDLSRIVIDACSEIGLIPCEKERPNKTTRSVTVNSISFGDAIKSLCGKGCDGKRLDPEVLRWPDSLLRELLVGYLQGDGSVSVVGRSQNRNVTAASVSRHLRDQMAFIARRLGYLPHIRQTVKDPSAGRSIYWIHFYGTDAAELADLCNKPYAEFLSPSRSKLHISGFACVQIIQAWSEHYEGDVFDLQVAEQSSFNAEGVIVHNSFVGPDMHSLKSIQAGGKPTQKLFGIHEKRGVTWRYNIDLDGERRPD